MTHFSSPAGRALVAVAAMWLATYNVHDCVGRDGRFDPGRIIEVLAEIDPDMVVLHGLRPE
jgi:endonuclease/exonuclease/phosphatase family metal-dependent hydrolase